MEVIASAAGTGIRMVFYGFAYILMSFHQGWRREPDSQMTGFSGKRASRFSGCR